MSEGQSTAGCDAAIESLGGAIDSDRLPTVPAVALAIMTKCKDPDVDFGKLAFMVSADPALAARFLTMANSGIFGGRHRITSLRAALVRLGLRLTHATSLAFALAAQDLKHIPAFNPDYYWRFALTTSHAAHALAERIPAVDAEDAYAAGLLQDIGVLAMQSGLPDEYGAVLETCQADPTLSLVAVEQQKLGTTHPMFGGYLLRKWGLPPEIYRPVAYHQCPEEELPEDLPDKARRLARVLRLGDTVGALFNGPDRNMNHEIALRMAEDAFGLARSMMRDILEEVDRGVAATARAFDIDPQTLSSYSTVRAASLRQMGRLAAEMEPDFRKYHARAADARRELDALEADRDRLEKELAYDSLTSLMRRSEFRKRCEAELARSVRHDLQLSVLFLDIDRFKSINDQFGHGTGDRMLESFGKYTLKHIRRSDVAGRYGGDEFALLLPETDLEAGLHIAERLRHGVARESGHWTENCPGFTVSVGVAHLHADQEAVDVEDLLEEADKCLYVAKSEGRNCTRHVSLPRME